MIVTGRGTREAGGGTRDAGRGRRDGIPEPRRRRNYTATIVRDTLENDASVTVETRETRRGQALEIPMRAAGGFVVRFAK